MKFPGIYPDKEGKDLKWILVVPLFLLVLGLGFAVMSLLGYPLGSDDGNPFAKPKKPAPLPGEPAKERAK